MPVLNAAFKKRDKVVTGRSVTTVFAPALRRSGSGWASGAVRYGAVLVWSWCVSGVVAVSREPCLGQRVAFGRAEEDAGLSEVGDVLRSCCYPR